MLFIIIKQNYNHEYFYISICHIVHRLLQQITDAVLKKGYPFLYTCRQFSETKVFHGPGSYKWLLGVEQHMSQGVHPHVEVGNVDTHSLLTHSTLQYKKSKKVVE